MGENLERVDVMKFKVGKVYSGFYNGVYIAFEVVEDIWDHYRLDITASSNEDKIALGIRNFYKTFHFFEKGNYKEVATDYTAAKIDLLLKLRQKEWFYEEVGDRK
ncbi:hypothetical protein HMPREF3291_05190 [Bacillus sp. HMSC76G11]|nr:hypothetical protein HMPREF3291_05190 [Bacillus sp. HMSC76G11]